MGKIAEQVKKHIRDNWDGNLPIVLSDSRKEVIFEEWKKALIYFTDGDGIYPEQKPDYETAFVFVRQTEKMNLVPKWAKKLLTEECTL
jgi:predicted metal-dependent peptidase